MLLSISYDWYISKTNKYMHRNLAFVGGIDLAYSRFDDDLHQATDEDGIKWVNYFLFAYLSLIILKLPIK